jgi:D-alanyl-D-alanine carboxypeptidase
VRGRVRAKTGFIAGTSSLSGVAETLDGRRFAFSILVNYPDFGGLNPSVWKPMQDALCKRLVETKP